MVSRGDDLTKCYSSLSR